MAADYPMYRDRDAEAQSFDDRRGLSGEIRLPDAPERMGVELLGPSAGTRRQMGGDPRPREIGQDRGRGDAKGPAERRPRPCSGAGLKWWAGPAKADRKRGWEGKSG